MTIPPVAPSPPRRHPDRRAALRRALRDGGLDAMLVTDLVNIRYLTGFTGSNAALLVAADDDGSVFCTDFRYAEQAAAEVPDLPTLIDRDSDRALVLATSAGRVAFEAHVLSVARHRELAAATSTGTELLGRSGLVEALRAVKDVGEVASLRAACAIADAALAGILQAGGIRVGRTEHDIALDLDERMRRLGSEDVSFPTILAAGENSAIPHHQPCGRVLTTGDLVKIDFGAVVDGYHSDMTRTFVLGRPAAWQADLHALVARAQRAGCDALRPGVAARTVDAAARDVIAAAGHAEHFGHGLGHGVGLQVHEAPWFASSGSAAVGIIAADMTVTVEPGVYLPGRGGVRIEDCGVVGPDGYTPFTLTPRDLVVL